MGWIILLLIAGVLFLLWLLVSANEDNQQLRSVNSDLRLQLSIGERTPAFITLERVAADLRAENERLRAKVKEVEGQNSALKHEEKVKRLKRAGR